MTKHRSSDPERFRWYINGTDLNEPGDGSSSWAGRPGKPVPTIGNQIVLQYRIAISALIPGEANYYHLLRYHRSLTNSVGIFMFTGGSIMWGEGMGEYGPSVDYSGPPETALNLAFIRCTDDYDHASSGTAETIAHVDGVTLSTIDGASEHVHVLLPDTALAPDLAGYKGPIIGNCTGSTTVRFNNLGLDVTNINAHSLRAGYARVAVWGFEINPV